MSDINTGVGPVPLEAQVAGGLWWPKSGSANATARPWYLVADERGFYLAVAPLGGDCFTLLYAGDIASLKSGDAYGYLLTGNQSDQATESGVPNGCCGYSHRSARSGAYLARAFNGIGQATAAQRTGVQHNGNATDVYAGYPGYSWGAYPNSTNNGLLTCQLTLVSGGVRGSMPGLLHATQDCANTFTSGVIVDGTDDMAGRRLMALRVGAPSNQSYRGTVFLDAAGPWSR